MNARCPGRLARSGWLAAAVLIAGCATPLADPIQTISMGRQDGGLADGFPPPGTIWRLDADEFKALGPIVPAPDPPPAPRKSRADRDGRYLFVPSIGYYGPRFGIGWGDAPFWPHYRYAPYPPYYYHPWHPRRR